MIIVTGARGVVGQPLCQLLQKKQMEYRAVSRSAEQGALQWDLTEPLKGEQKSLIENTDTLIHCAPIWLLTSHLSDLKAAGLKRLIVFSSSSIEGKQSSGNNAEQQLVQQLLDAEQAISEFSAQHEIELTILRPSMIYGHGLDQNISKIASLIRRFGVAVIAAPASGERQPVHADDLAIACLFLLDNKRSYGQTYLLAGAETLSYRAMVERIFTALGKQPRILALPPAVVRIGLRIASVFGSFDYTDEMAARMNMDLSYDYTAATRDFGFMPREFLQNPDQDLAQNLEEQS